MKLPVNECFKIMQFIIEEHKKVTKGKVEIEPGDELRMILECGGAFTFEAVLTRNDKADDDDDQEQEQEQEDEE